MSRVVLLSYTPDVERACAAAMRSCYSIHPAFDVYTNTPESGKALADEKTFDDERVGHFIRKSLELGHEDILEHGSLTFALYGFGDSTLDELQSFRFAHLLRANRKLGKTLKENGWYTKEMSGRAVLSANPRAYRALLKDISDADSREMKQLRIAMSDLLALAAPNIFSQQANQTYERFEELRKGYARASEGRLFELANGNLADGFSAAVVKRHSAPANAQTMQEINQPAVVLFSYTPEMERTMAAVTLFLYSDSEAERFLTQLDSLSAKEAQDIVQKILLDGNYHAPFNHAALTYDIEGFSRAFTHQLVRHRHAVYSQQSQRYVKRTRGGSYIRPPDIRPDARVKINAKGIELDVTFDDVMDMATQAEIAFLEQHKAKAEDARFLRPGGATTNIVMTATPEEYLSVFDFRTTSDVQWEFQSFSYAALALAKSIAPTIFKTLPVAAKESSVRERIEEIDKAVDSSNFWNARRGDVVEMPLDGVKLKHQVHAYIKY